MSATDLPIEVASVVVAEVVAVLRNEQPCRRAL